MASSLLRLSVLPSSLPHRRLRPLSATPVPSTPFPSRVVSAASYTLPLLNSLPLGRGLFARSPLLTSVFSPVLPVLSLYHSVPFLPFLAFFVLYLAVARNPSLSRFARFNAMQALMLDVGLSLPHIAVRIFGVPPGLMGYRLLEACYGAVFVLVAFCWLYCFLMTVLGKTPFLPFLSAAAAQQLP